MVKTTKVATRAVGTRDHKNSDERQYLKWDYVGSRDESFVLVIAVVNASSVSEKSQKMAA